MKHGKLRRIWILALVSLLLVGCGPIQQRLADGTAVAAGRQVNLPFSGGESVGDNLENGSGGGEESSAQQTAAAWEMTLQASLDALLSSTSPATKTFTPTPIPEDTDTNADNRATQTVEAARLTGLASSLTAIAAASATPTPTPPPSATPTMRATNTQAVSPSPTQIPCLAFRFVAHVSFPPDTEVNPSTSFFKSWQVQNVGTCTWTGSYALVYESGFQLGGTSPLLLGSGVSVAPNQYVTLTIQLWTPPQSGTYTSSWLLQDSDGNTFGGGANQNEPLLVRVIVPGQSPPVFTQPVSTSPPFYTSTPSP